MSENTPVPHGRPTWHTAEETEAYWRQALQGVTAPTPLIVGRPPAKRASEAGSRAWRELQLPTGSTAALAAFARAQGVSIDTAVIGAWALVLHNYAGEDDVVFGVGGLDPLPRRMRISPDARLAPWLRTLQAEEQVLSEHAHPALARIQGWSLVPENTPLFESVLVLDGSVPGTREAESARSPSGRYPLVIQVASGTTLRLGLEYDTRRFDADTASRLLGHLRTLLEAMPAGPDRLLGELPILTAEERTWLRQFAVPRGGTAIPSQCLHHRFEAQVARTPDAVALVYEGQTLTYRQLDLRAGGLARQLRQRGVGPDVLVGLCVERSLDLVVGILAILKAGGAYVPLDPGYPAERLAFMLEDSGVRLLLTQARLVAGLPSHRADVLCIDTPSPEHETAGNGPAITPDHLAYVIYTSGSTGRPKGVLVTHRNVARLFDATDAWFQFGPEDTWTLLHSHAFDFSVWEIWGALLYGGRLVIVPPRIARSPEALTRLLSREHVTVLNQTPSAFRVLAPAILAEPAATLALRYVIFGGEALELPSLRPWFERFDEARPRLVNMYGITETTVHVTYRPITLADVETATASPIGRPIPDLQLALLDRYGKPVPIGVAGEIYVGGSGVARGYLERPELTAQRFVSVPFGGEAEGRWYRSGDLARWRADGDLEYLGRLDQQVKIRGFRIELGEIEAVLAEHPAMRQAVVIAREDVPGDRRLVAYYAADTDQLSAVEEFRRLARAKLPDYMVPSAFVRVDRLPLTANGKIDRVALPPPDARPLEPDRASVASRTPLERYLAELWCGVLRRPSVGLHDRFFEIGGDSLLEATIIGKLRARLGENISLVSGFEAPTIAEQALYLMTHHASAVEREFGPGAAATGSPPTESPAPTAEAPRAHDDEPARPTTVVVSGGPQPVEPRAGHEDDRVPRRQPSEAIAIVGMAGRFPGARTVAELWDNLCRGIESVSFFTPEELEASGVDPRTRQDPHYVNAAAVMEDADRFDAEFFGFTPRAAELTDPQHRVLLETAWAALEDAGLNPEGHDGVTGVFGGVGPNTYVRHCLSAHRSLLEAAGYYQIVIGNEGHFPTTRVSYKLNLKGPSLNIQTACSTSGVAIHVACQSLLAGECDTALAGAARIRVPLKAGYLYQPDGIPSPDGHCRAFDASASGTVNGSGVAVIVLKRLSDAIRDGHQIYAVIKGSAVNNDGAVKVGYTAPSVQGQTAVIVAAQSAAAVDPDSIGFVEAHGTGTVVGDPIEVAALTQAFRRRTTRRQFCALGSIKANLGHLDAAAGMAGLIKTALALRTGRIPPLVNFGSPNPALDLESSPFFINTEPLQWQTPDGTPRRAAVSCFGIGGTNAHLVLEEAPTLPPSGPSRPWQLLTLAARTPTALDRMTAELAEHLARHPDQALADVAYTGHVGRRPLAHRRVVVCRDAADAIGVLRGADAGRLASGVARVDDASVVFMFPGHGAQYIDMGLALYESEVAFREHTDRCLDLFRAHMGVDVRPALFPRDGGAEEAARLLERPSVSSAVIFTMEWAMAQLLLAWGVRPAAVTGTSLGEYTAACLAGVFSLDDAVRILGVRGRLLDAMPRGAMLTVALPEAEVRALAGDHLALAAVNAPTLCVVSGGIEAIEDLERRLTERDVQHARVRVTTAFHSPMLDSGLDEFRQAVEQIRLTPPAIPYLSTLMGTWATTELADPEYWVRQWRHGVRFSDALDVLLREPGRILIEVGPGRSLSSMTRRHPRWSPDRVAVPTMRHPSEDRPDLAFLLGSLGRCWLAGMEIDWRAFHAGEDRRRVSLPTYPFERKRYWLEPTPSGGAVATMANAGALPTVDTGATPVPQTVAVPPVTTTAETTATTSESRQPRILHELCGVIHELSGQPAGEIDPQASFLELGFDSLFLTGAVGAFQRKFGVKLSFRQLLDEAPTLEALAAYIDRNLPPDPMARVVEAGRSSSGSPAPTAPQAAPASGAGSLTGWVIQELRLIVDKLERASIGAVSSADPLVVSGEGAPATASRDTAGARTAGAEAAAGADPGGGGAARSHGPWKPIDKRRHGDLTPRQREQLAALIARYTERTRRSKELTAAQRPHLADPRTVSGFNRQWKEMVYPIAITSARGSRVVDVDGNDYVDLTMGFGANLLGHSPEFVTRAIAAQLDKGMDISGLPPLAGRVAAAICRMTGMERVSFANTGSEANMAALRIARTVTGREKIAVFAGAYHGIFDEVLVKAVTSDGVRRSVPIAPGILPAMVENVLVLDYGDPRSLDVLEAQRGQLAAVIVEPVATRHPDLQPRDFLHALREQTRRSGTALILDEVVTGFRLQPRGAQGYFGIEADIATYGKLIGGGMPIAVVAGKAAYMDALDGGEWRYGDDSFPATGVTFFAGTFVRHPLALAAAAAVLEHLEGAGPHLQADLNERSSRLIQRLNGLFVAQHLPIWIEHCGSMLYFTFPGGDDLTRLVFYELRARGLHIYDRPAFLSTAHTDEDLQFIERVVEEGVLEMRSAGFIGFVEATREAPSDGGTASTVPSTEPQREIWLATRMDEDGSRAFVESVALHLRGACRVEALRTALQQLVARHDTLRSRFSEDGTTLVIDGSVSIDVPLEDVSGRPAAEQRQQLDARARQLAWDPFDLVRGPVLRAHVVKLGEDHHVLLIAVHHIAVDGWSLGHLLDDLGALYTAVATGQPAALPAARRFADYARKEQEFKATPAGQATEQYWLEQFADTVPVLQLPVDRPRPAVKTYRAGHERFTLPPALSQDLRRLGAAHGSTLFTTLLAGLKILLHRLTGQDDIVVAVASAGQAAEDGQDVVGHCVHLLPVRSRLDAETPFASYLQALKRRVLDAQDHQRYTYATLLEKLRLRRERSRLPLASVIFNLDSGATPPKFEGLRVDIVWQPRGAVNFDLDVNIAPSGDGLVVDWYYNLDLFEADTARHWVRCYRTLLEALVEDPRRDIGAVRVLPAEEHEKLLGEWNATGQDFPPSRVQSLVEAQVARAPDAVAVVFEDFTLTYRHLNERANRLAHHLRELGVGPDVLVGLCLERSADLLVALLAVLKAGGAYVPLDPAYPAQRLGFMLEDSGASVLVTHSALRDRIPAGQVTVVCLDSDARQISRRRPDNPRPWGDEQSLAYVIYTSGSTGRPKGVEIPHRAVSNFLHAMAETLGLGDGDRLLAVTTISFDIAVLELVLPLVAGAQVEIASPNVAGDGRLLAERLRRSEATVMQATPATWRLLLEAGWAGSPTFTALCGGEPLPRDLASALSTRAGAVWNLYGPTETTIWSTAHRVRSGDGPVPIGRPLANTQLYVLDRRGQPVPIGVPGELYIGGHGVARGYHGRPELTAERFVRNPLGGDPDERLYRTGDLVRYRADGSLEFLGRLDNQVKLRGFRIELGEIEAVLTDLDEVRQAAAVVREDRPGEQRLVAYLVTDSEPRRVVGQARARLRQTLPDYMVPSLLLVLPALPLTSNGKIDRRALPAPDDARPELDSQFVAPRTETESALARIWAEVLGLQQIGVHDSFFDLGGYSVLAAAVMLRIRTAFGVDLPLRTLFEAPDIASLAARLETQLFTRAGNGGAAHATVNGQREEIVL